jgi:chromosome partitioning protein
MAQIIGVVSQKGGVGKSTLARLIACEYSRSGWRVKIADMDVSQGTSYHWHSRRLQHAIEPEVSVEQFARVKPALKVADNYDLVLFDGAPHATAATLEIAHHSDLVVLPTGIALDDLEPTIKLAHELKQKAIPIKRIAVALCRVGDSENELNEARAYIEAAGYGLLPGAIPERTAYRRASDVGRAATETSFSSLNNRADEVVQGIVDRLATLTA